MSKDAPALKTQTSANVHFKSSDYFSTAVFPQDFQAALLKTMEFLGILLVPQWRQRLIWQPHVVARLIQVIIKKYTCKFLFKSLWQVLLCIARDRLMCSPYAVAARWRCQWWWNDEIRYPHHLFIFHCGHVFLESECLHLQEALKNWLHKCKAIDAF